MQPSHFPMIGADNAPGGRKPMSNETNADVTELQERLSALRRHL